LQKLSAKLSNAGGTSYLKNRWLEATVSFASPNIHPSPGV